jgi:hypothetical protein
MRQLIIAGVVLVGLGAFLFFRGGSFTTKHDVVQVGDVKVTADEKQSVPPWLGGAAMVVGVALIVAGAKTKRA